MRNVGANNEIEHYFGRARHLERRATGRKGASPTLVVCGSNHVLRLQDIAAWKQHRPQVKDCHATRRAQVRCRRDPAAYLASLEQAFLRPALPPTITLGET